MDAQGYRKSYLMMRTMYKRIPKYPPEQILWWRERIRDGVKQKDLATELCISESRLSRILSGDGIYDR